MFDNYSHGFGRDFGEVFNDPDFMEIMSTVIAVFAFFLLIMFAIGITLYIFRSIGLYRLSKNRGMSGSGLAWIPVVGAYRVGSVADDIAERNGSRSYYRYILLAGSIFNIVMPVISLISSLAWLKPVIQGYGYDRAPRFDAALLNSGISSITSLVSLGVYVVTVIALHQIYKCYRPQSATTWTVLTAIPFTNFLHPFFLFALRDSAPVGDWNGQSQYYPIQQNLPPNINWNTPPQYPTYGHPPTVQPEYNPPANAGYQPPAAPNPPELWELDGSASPPPPQAPWENDGKS